MQLIRGGSGYFELLLRLIAGAKDSIHLQTYIFEDDETGTRVATALKEAAGRKVSVYLMADGYASQKLPGSFTQELRNAGIHVRFFEPVFR
ncbi:MAG TPA: phospholipase D-like domain-containing protein, partial [Ferruginibacter sp.]|nr:phospholipase D-like domain-containing protein [Ferruginibacter sp.]